MTIIAEFVGSLLLALLTGTWTPLPVDRIPPDMPAPVVFAAEWHSLDVPGDRVNTLIVLQDGAARFGATSSIVSPPQGPTAGPGE